MTSMDDFWNFLNNTAGATGMISQRRDGSMKPPLDNENRNSFLKKIGLDYRNMITPILEHGSAIRRVTQKEKGKIINGYDGIATDDKELILSITVADCLPLFFIDPKKKAIALVHAGWRSLCGGIVRNTLDLFSREFSSKSRNIIVGIGPGICSRHFEVKEDVAVNFANYSQAIVRKSNQIHVDLKNVAKLQLVESGIDTGNIGVSPECTFCLKDKYFSFRRDGPGEMEAMMSVLFIKK